MLTLIFVFPANWVGFLLGVGVAVGLSWKGRIPGWDWLAVAFFNLPAMLCYYSALAHENPPSTATVISIFLVTIFGVGGFGLGWFATNVVISVMRALHGRKNAT
jgi:hypothetical protein